MQFDKYKALLIEKIKLQISEWFESDGSHAISNEEIHRFLHSAKGTAGTIQLGGIYQIVSELLEKLESENQNVWERDELRNFLYPLITNCYEYEHFSEGDKKSLKSRNENLPLIQIIDDDVSMLVLLKDALEDNGWMVIASTEPDKAIEQYYELSPDCLIIDVFLPIKNGFQILDDIHKHNKQKFIPKIMISSDTTRETRLNAYRTGADDFIAKPIDIEELIIRVERQLQRKHIFDQSVLLDELTQVYNRRFFNEIFEKRMKELQKSNQYFSVALLDLDLFKNINDKYGHYTGDQVLIRFAQFLKEHIQSTDFVFRYGGEEFIVLLSESNAQESEKLLSSLLEQFSKIEFSCLAETFSVTFSGGVYFVNNSNVSLSQVLQSADKALYMAKEQGRARVLNSDCIVPKLTDQTLNVSVVDDDAIVRTMLVKVLQNMKFNQYELNIQAYEDGHKFFESNRLEDQGEHFLILDGVMPVMDGLEILQKVKEGEYKYQITVLMLTARKSENDIARALKLGADDYVTKPFSILELQARIQRLIQRMS
jgi:two-component system, cell cycle response regulator